MKKYGKNLIAFSLIFLILELLSYWAGFSSAVAYIVFSALCLVTLAAALCKLEYGLLIVFGELFIGSMGHLFTANVFGYALPIRVALWLIIMGVFAVQFIIKTIKKTPDAYWPVIKNFFLARFSAKGKWTPAGIFTTLFIFIAIGLGNGLVHGNSLAFIFSDFNAWLYWLLLFPAIVVYNSPDKEEGMAAMERLKIVFLAGALWISLKTLFLLFIFTHDLALASEIYSWLRRTLVGEMTLTLTGWPRVFIQAQIYTAFGFWLLFWNNPESREPKNLWRRDNIISLVVSGLFLSSLLISFSRSFWVALLAVSLISLFFVWRVFSWKKLLIDAGWLIISGVLGFAFIYLTVAIPLPNQGGGTGQFGVDLMERLSDTNGAAVASRWSLLPALFQRIMKEPILGQGYGATVTYFSQDPRVLQQNPSGQYTTYAFEWSYLELWLKIGLVGLLSYIFLISVLIILAFNISRKKKGEYLFLGLSASLLFLAITNVFTPYLNHPLGIGFIIASSCLIWLNRVY